MYSHFNTTLRRNIFTIHPGEYYCSEENIIIATVLGSCIAVAMYDEKRHAGGLNHFMLPASYKNLESFDSIEAGKYGIFAMELLINGLLKLGIHKADIKAKVFGGGSFIDSTDRKSSTVARNNIEFALSFLRLEGIPVVSQDTGGLSGRKIFFYPRSAKVLLKRLSGSLVKTVKEQEEEYLKALRTGKRSDGNFTRF